MRVSVSSRSGFSFPELIISAGILGFAIAGLIAFFVNSASLNEASRNTTIALSHANLVLEDIRNETFSSVANNIANGAWNWNAATITDKGLVALKDEIITTTCSGTTFLTITVTVVWNDKGGRLRSIVLTTMTGGS